MSDGINRCELTSLCRVVEAALPGTFVSIYQLNRQNRLLYRAGPRIPDSMRPEFSDIPIGPRVGSCGSAAWSGRRVVVDSIAEDQRWDDYRRLPLACGFTACWSEPVNSDEDRVLGTIGVYFRDHPTSVAHTKNVTTHASRIAANIFSQSAASRIGAGKTGSANVAKALTGLSRLLANKFHAVGTNLVTIEEDTQASSVTAAAIEHSRRALRNGLLACWKLDRFAKLEHTGIRSVPVATIVENVVTYLARREDIWLDADLPDDNIKIFVNPDVFESALIALCGHKREVGETDRIVRPEKLHLTVREEVDDSIAIVLEGVCALPTPTPTPTPTGNRLTSSGHADAWILNHFAQHHCRDFHATSDHTGRQTVQFLLPRAC